MGQIPVEVSGAITVALTVGLGVFVYPSLLRLPQGKGIVAIATVLLVVLFFLFDRRSGLSGGHSAGVAIAFALAPVIAGIIVYRLQRGNSP